MMITIKISCIDFVNKMEEFYGAFVCVKRFAANELMCVCDHKK